MVLEEYDYATEIAVLKEEAEERGIHRKAMETARILKRKGLSLELIAECTDLSLEEIEKL